MNDSACHLVDRSVTAHSNDNVDMVVLGFCGNHAGMSRIFSEFDFIVESFVVKIAFNQFGNSGFAGRSRNGVHNENNLFFLHLLFFFN